MVKRNFLHWRQKKFGKRHGKSVHMRMKSLIRGFDYIISAFVYIIKAFDYTAKGFSQSISRGERGFIPNRGGRNQIIKRRFHLLLRPPFTTSGRYTNTAFAVKIALSSAIMER